MRFENGEELKRLNRDNEFEKSRLKKYWIFRTSGERDREEKNGYFGTD